MIFQDTENNSSSPNPRSRRCEAARAWRPRVASQPRPVLYPPRVCALSGGQCQGTAPRARPDRGPPRGGDGWRPEAAAPQGGATPSQAGASPGACQTRPHVFAGARQEEASPGRSPDSLSRVRFQQNFHVAGIVWNSMGLLTTWTLSTSPRHLGMRQETYADGIKTLGLKHGTIFPTLFPMYVGARLW